MAAPEVVPGEGPETVVAHDEADQASAFRLVRALRDGSDVVFLAEGMGVIS